MRRGFEADRYHRHDGNLRRLDTNGLIGWWDFRGGFGTLNPVDNARDNITTLENVSALVFWGNGKGQGVFDGIDERAYATNLMVTGAGARTVLCWAKTPVDQQQSYCDQGYTGTGERFDFHQEVGGVGVFAAGGNRIFDWTISVNQWHHVGISIADNDTVWNTLFYLDGVRVTTLRSEGGVDVAYNTAENNPLNIGRSNSAQRYYQGSLADFMYFNRQLSDADIESVFETTRGRYGR